MLVTSGSLNFPPIHNGGRAKLDVVKHHIDKSGMKQERNCLTRWEKETAEMYELGDQSTSDISVHLRDRDGRQGIFHCHSLVLKSKSKFVAERLSTAGVQSNSCIEVLCPSSEYDNYVKLLKLLYLPEDQMLDFLESGKTALGVLRASIALRCDTITQSCTQFLEAVPWDDKEEEEILKVVPNLGPAAMSVLSRVQPVNLNSTKNVVLSAIRFATTVDRSFPPFTDELKTSAQEQLEYMLVEDEETPQISKDDDVHSALRTGLDKLISTFKDELNLLTSEFIHSPEATEQKILQSLVDLEWLCNLLPKLEMMKDFVSSWIEISDYVVEFIQDDKYSTGLWAVKFKIIELTGKTLDAVGYGAVVLPTPSRVHLLQSWLPYLRTMKPILDSKSEEDERFVYKMDADLCQNIEGAIVSLILALPSNDQAEILAEWMKRTELLSFPDLSEAFEVWCYRIKTAKRRLAVGINGVTKPTVSL